MDKATNPKGLESMQVTASHVRRLEREVKGLKENYDSLKIKTLCMSDEDKKDPQFKQDAGKLDALRKQIAVKEKTIIEIKLAL